MSPTLEVTPSKIVKAVERDQKYPETLSVCNTGKEWAGYQVEMKKPYGHWGKADPDNFALDPGESTTMELVLRVPRDAKTGDHIFSLEITNEQAREDMTSVPITLKVPIQPWLKYLIIASIVLLVLVTLFLIGRAAG